MNRISHLVVALLVVVWAAAAAALPSDQLLQKLKPQGYVSDFANVLSAPQRTELETFLTGLERKTGVEIAVVTVPSLDGGDVDDFANRLFEKWRVGKKGRDNGVMILAAIQDRKARIEVGYGLEPVLPDAAAGRILRELMFPQFKQGNYAAGLQAATRRVAAVVSGEVKMSATPAHKPAIDDQMGAAFISIFVLIGSLIVGSGLGSKQIGLVIFGLLFSGVPMGAGAMVSPGWLLGYGIVAAVGLVAGFRGGRRLRRSGGTRRSWSSGSSSWGGWSSGGGFSSGGFSSGGGGGFSGFGGGSSGGGGASGGW